jgi:hypothetical protein
MIKLKRTSKTVKKLLDSGGIKNGTSMMSFL